MGSMTPISVIGKLRPAQGLTHLDFTTSTTALPDAGDGLAADSLTQPSSNTTTGVFMFEMSEGFGMELHFVTRGAGAETATAIVFREISICENGTDNPSQVTHRHLCNVSLTASTAQAGVEEGPVDEEMHWCVPVVSNDAGLTPVGTRTMQGLTTGAAGSVIVDPVCAGRIKVFLRCGTATGAAVYASKFSGL